MLAYLYHRFIVVTKSKFRIKSSRMNND